MLKFQKPYKRYKTQILEEEEERGEKEPTVQVKRFLMEASIPTYVQQPKNDAAETGKKRGR